MRFNYSLISQERTKKGGFISELLLEVPEEGQMYCKVYSDWPLSDRGVIDIDLRRLFRSGLVFHTGFSPGFDKSPGIAYDKDIKL